MEKFKSKKNSINCEMFISQMLLIHLEVTSNEYNFPEHNYDKPDYSILCKHSRRIIDNIIEYYKESQTMVLVLTLLNNLLYPEIFKNDSCSSLFISQVWWIIIML
jgi:hypothetical protein